MERLTIGRLAAAAGVGVETVRFYERKGLLERPARPAAGFRAYSREAIARIAFVREAQEVGFTLREIRDLLALHAKPGADCAAVRGRAAAKIAQLETRIAQCERMRATLRALVAECPGRGALEKCSIVAGLSARANRSRPVRRRARGTRSSQMKTTELTVQGMHCEGCAKTIEALLAAEPGVKAATASFAGGSARVIYDPGAVDLTRLVQAVERAGYRVPESG